MRHARLAVWIALILVALPREGAAQDGEAITAEPEPQAGETASEAPDADAIEPRTTSEPEVGHEEETAESAPTTEHGEGEETEPDPEHRDEGLTFAARVGGEYQHRLNAMSDIPLQPLPRTDPAETGQLGQNYWGEQWLRLYGELRLRPILRLFGELDLLFGVAYGDLAIGTAPAQWPRDTYGYPGLRLRQLYLDWLTPIGLLRVGQMAFSWGLGMVANDGEVQPVFGDYRFGDLVRRVLFATRPAGEDSPFTIAVAGDWVAWDQTADFDRRGDLAFQGILAAFYEKDDDSAGVYVAYRNQSNPLNDALEVFVADAFARLHFAEPSGGRIEAAFEVAYIRGTTSYARTLTHAAHDVEQLMAIARVGRAERHVDIMFEGGYASGDSNGEDGVLHTATMDPDHRVGLVLFPEVIAWQTARAAFLAQSPELFGRPARGAELLPTNGGVSGAYYLFPYFMWRPLEWLETRTGALLAWSSADVVDPFAQRALSQSVNFRGGDPRHRDLGLELDGSILLHGPIAEGVVLSGGIEGGVLFPGHAFDDAEGNSLGPIGMARARLGIRY